VLCLQTRSMFVPPHRTWPRREVDGQQLNLHVPIVECTYTLCYTIAVPGDLCRLSWRFRRVTRDDLHMRMGQVCVMGCIKGMASQ
jgi:hypothetical protein